MKNLKPIVTQEELRRLFELRSRGILLDEDMLEEMKAAHRGLVIYQSGTNIENVIFQLDLGGTGYMLAAAIHNASDRILRPQEPRLEMAWPESHFRWLENPLARVPREYVYSFPSPGPAGFDRDVVLNHRLRRGCKLDSDDWFEGLLLAVGEASIPDRYVDRQSLRMRLSILDGRGNCYASDMTLTVRREGQVSRRQAKESQRSRRELASVLRVELQNELG